MKTLLSELDQRRKEFQDYERDVERKFSEFIKGIPGWRKRLTSIIITNGYDLGGLNLYEDIEDQLIPEVRNLNITSDERVSFKIRIPSDTWVSRYLEVGYFPLTWLTDPDSVPFDPSYLEGKLYRRRTAISRLEKEISEEQGRLQLIIQEAKLIEDILKKRK